MSKRVLIVGAGPVGLIVALELAHHGVASTIIDRSPEAMRFPKMDITNGRSMELFRRLGFADRLRAVGVPPQHSFDCLWALPDGNPPVGRWTLPSVDAQRAYWAERNDGVAPLEVDQRVPQSTFETMARDLILIRPDQFVVWRGNEAPDAVEWDRIVDVVTGRAPTGDIRISSVALQ